MHRARHKAGHWIWVDVQFHLTNAGQSDQCVVVRARDVTGRREAEIALAASEVRYRVLAETTSDVITRLDMNFQRKYVSPSCRTMFGYEPHEMIGAQPSATVHPDDSEHVKASAAMLAAGEIEGDRVMVTYRARHKRGHWVWIETAISLLRDEQSGKPQSLICSLRDITERHEAARDLELAKAAAEQAALAKSEFVANMSHELQTPLTAIIGVHDLLGNDPTLNERQKRLIRIAGDAGVPHDCWIAFMHHRLNETKMLTDDRLSSDVERLIPSIEGRAECLDRDGAFPIADVNALGSAGLLIAPFAIDAGGCDLGSDPFNPLALYEVLVKLGTASLSLGRLYEGHVNAVKLVRLYGCEANVRLLLKEARAGRLSGVWMAEAGSPLRLEMDGDRHSLFGQKILASGAGQIRRPLVAAKNPAGASQMLIPYLADDDRADISSWRPLGMKATATGTVDFTALPILPDEFVGEPGDYLRSPYFRGGAWRVTAVQLGALEAIMNLYAYQLAQGPHCQNPIQLTRYGEAEIALETARLWVRQACVKAEDASENADDIDAYVDLARNAFEAAALDVIASVQKAIGLKAFLQPNPLERIIRDLSTYLRQPALDLSLISGGEFNLRKRLKV